MTNWYEPELSSVLTELNTDAKEGLSEKSIPARQAESGKNEFISVKKTSLPKRILYQLQDVSIIVLLIAAALSFALALYQNSGLIEPIVILAIVILNVVLAITQEGRAEKALEALADLNAPTCTVIRDGVHATIDTAELVPGDIIVLETGSIVPADARILEATGLFSDESSLTGESEPAEKDVSALLSGQISLGDQDNMVFSGCAITAGHGLAVVTAIGMNTQMGQIASHLHTETRVKTPLQMRLDRLGRMISWIAIAAAFVLLAVGLRGGTDFPTMIMIAISMAVAAVPETLSLIVTLSLTNGVQKMVGKNALIRKLPAVETLGSISVICSDKTGTLTQNRMTIQQLWLTGEALFSSNCDFTRPQIRFLMMLAMASNATAEPDAQGVTQFRGDATEVAIMRLLDEKGYNKSTAEQQFPKIGEVPFSSERKLMTVALKSKDGGYTILTKGALDRMPLRQMTAEEEAEFQSAHDSFAEGALRVIALGYKHLDELPDLAHLEEEEKDLTLMGLIGLIDPPRPEAKEAIQKAKMAGVRTVMITGDHAVTAEAIAKELGILTEGQRVLTGAQLAEMHEQELYDTIQNYSVYARVSPEDKIRIVKAWQANGDVVAMTGDGVNDAPALRAADVGIAMGKAGTEVAKNASDMILTDDNFATIVEAVSEGRNVYENIKKTIYFLLVCNLSEIVIMLFSQIAGWGIFLTPIMLLLINLLGDGIPGFQLSRGVSDENIMDRKPIQRDQSFFSEDLLIPIIRQTIACSAVSLAAFFFGAFIAVSAAVAPNVAIGQTMAFLTVGFTSILHIFNVRSRKSIFKVSLSSNKPLVVSAVLMLGVFIVMALTPPLQSLFGLTALSGIHWLIVIGFSIIPTLVREMGVRIDNNPYVLAKRRRKHELLHRTAAEEQ